ncbi:hypothetical protein QR98_0041040 [Sarcoptes scabiei]|uniref:Uncharacterized protein n=1 Tax=Sarcoptes scabiei TaxID=52283 RepID=A0A132A3R4_SARSC|nr:hypothetical protein QR98_0041040 [Sarcoptes scabiei]
MSDYFTTCPTADRKKHFNPKMIDYRNQSDAQQQLCPDDLQEHLRCLPPDVGKIFLLKRISMFTS